MLIHIQAVLPNYNAFFMVPSQITMDDSWSVTTSLIIRNLTIIFFDFPWIEWSIPSALMFKHTHSPKYRIKAIILAKSQAGILLLCSTNVEMKVIFTNQMYYSE